jgi:hypothetical protein
VAILVVYLLSFLVRRPDHPDLPPFYSEPGYLPWLGSLVQFATGPRKFLQRAALAKGDVFTIQLFGKRMTFLTGSEGHAHFFKQREHVFDIREAYAMTVITFGPGVCYDCPQSKMAQQFAFFKDGLSDESFVKYMELVQDEVATFFEQEWGEEGEADLLQSLSDLYTLTSSRCLLGDEIRNLWKDSGMAEHYCTSLPRVEILFLPRRSSTTFLTPDNDGSFLLYQWLWITRLSQSFSSFLGSPTPIDPSALPLANSLLDSFSKSLINGVPKKPWIPTTSLPATFCKFSWKPAIVMEHP